MRTIKSSQCFVCGPDNRIGLRVAYYRDGETGSRATYVAREEHCGWQGIVHGGVIFSLLDESIGWALYFQNLTSVTALAQIRFRLPLSVDSVVVVQGWTLESRRSLIKARAEMRLAADETVLVATLDATLKAMADASARLRVTGSDHDH